MLQDCATTLSTVEPREPRVTWQDHGLCRRLVTEGGFTVQQVWSLYFGLTELDEEHYGHLGRSRVMIAKSICHQCSELEACREMVTANPFRSKQCHTVHPSVAKSLRRTDCQSVLPFVQLWGSYFQIGTV